MEQRVLKMKDAKIREDADGKYLEGYFVVFDSPYHVYDGWVETIERGAFTDCLRSDEDIKVLWNHDSNIVLGSTSNKTAYLFEDDVGLFGRVQINENDQDAMNAYARIERGDVSGCSFGFDIGTQKERWDSDGTYRTSIENVAALYEVSPCTFPAYKSTNISARNKQALEAARKAYEQATVEKMDMLKSEMLKRLKGAKEC